LESAHFERTSIRKTARANTLSTEASYRFERIVDPAGVVRAVDRVAQLIMEWAGGEVASGVIDVAAPLPPSRVITMPVERVNQVLGTAIPRAELLRALRGLELPVQEEGDQISVVAPSFRPDLLEEMDLIEEVARIYGYEHVPTTVPGRVTGAGRLAPELQFESRLRNLLTSSGLFETVSYTLIDYRQLDLLRLPVEAPERKWIVAVRNPKSEEFTHLRPTMLLSMLDGLRNNARRNIDDVQIFEVGRIFRSIGGEFRFNYAPHSPRVVQQESGQDTEGLLHEQRTVGIALMGRPWTTRWGGGDREVDFYWLKGIIEQCLFDLSISDVHYFPAEHPALHPGRCAEVRAGDKIVGVFGEVHPQVAKNFDLSERAYLAELNLEVLLDVAGAGHEAPAISRFPADCRDIAFLAQESYPAEQAEEVIVRAAGNFAESVALFDVYQGSHVPEGWRSLAYRITFRAEERTLSDTEVNQAMEHVRQALSQEIGAQLR
jgi:phenylalanyl-tRNA synthetase beta chain